MLQIGTDRALPTQLSMNADNILIIIIVFISVQTYRSTNIQW